MDRMVENLKESEIKTPEHYDNSKGTLYKVSEERKWNSYVFDAVKRLERAEKKGEFDSDIDKTINLLLLYKKERNEKLKKQISES